ncbi:hypothetical protein M405DRAFT_778825 [Rhizopogon salebrosus TDB-379]|nr:hypothetical protein M405DRAFT_778825 [Rhizopogon salebrosus TDB-379]
MIQGARGDALLSAGQFSDAAKPYSEAILLSPADYLLFYKPATAYFSTRARWMASSSPRFWY